MGWDILVATPLFYFVALFLLLSLFFSSSFHKTRSFLLLSSRLVHTDTNNHNSPHFSFTSFTSFALFHSHINNNTSIRHPFKSLNNTHSSHSFFATPPCSLSFPHIHPTLSLFHALFILSPSPCPSSLSFSFLLASLSLRSFLPFNKTKKQTTTSLHLFLSSPPCHVFFIRRDCFN